MGWRRIVIVVGVTLVVPRCTCAPPCSNHQAPHATFDVSQGCAGYYCAMTCDPGWADCNNNQADGCETSLASLPPNEVVDTTYGISCDIQCMYGFFDCDGNKQNGCESTVPCPVGFDAGESKGAHVVAAMTSPPRGLVVCAGREYFFDGSTLRFVESSTLGATTVLDASAPPARGVACDGAYVYWATLSSSDASTPDGALYRVPIGSTVTDVIASGLDTSSGIDVRDGAVLAMTTMGLVLSPGVDAGVVAWMPASQSAAYKAFALGAGEDWSLDHARIVRRATDAGAAIWIDDAGSPSAILSNGSGEPLVVLHADDDAGGSDLFAYARDDAGMPALTPIVDASVHPIVATTGGATVIAASEDAIYAVAAGAVTPIYTSSDRIVDVAVDGAWVVWTTSNPPALWRGAIP